MTATDPVRLAIFDLDDTLLETAAAVRIARTETLARVFPDRGAKTMREAQSVWRATTPIFRDRQLGALLAVVACAIDGRLPADLDIDALYAGYQARQAELIRPRVAVVAAARALEATGHLLAIVSNGDPLAQRHKLGGAGLADLVPASRMVVCDGVEIAYKPDPAAIHTVVRAVGAGRAAIVGDRATDVLAGRLAGIRTVRIRTRCADVDRGSALAPMLRPDRYVPASGCYEAVHDLLN